MAGIGGFWLLKGDRFTRFGLLFRKRVGIVVSLYQIPPIFVRFSAYFMTMGWIL
jgi:hypothetical protein